MGKKVKSKLRTLVEKTVKEFILLGLVSGALFLVSTFAKGHFIPVTTNGAYLEELAEGGSGTATATINSSLMEFAHIAFLVMAILVILAWLAKLVIRIVHYVNGDEIE